MTFEVRRYRNTSALEYDIRFDLPDGTEYRERRKSKLKTAKAVREFAESRERKLWELLTAPQPALVAVRPPTLSGFKTRYMEHCLALRQKPSTLDNKRYSIAKWLEPQLGKLHLDEITNDRVSVLKASLGVVGWSCGNNILRALTNMLRVAIELGVLAAMPCTVKTFRRHLSARNFYEPDVLDRMIAAAPHSDVLVMVLLGAKAGLRAGEIAGLEWSDIDFTRGTLTVRRAVWKGYVGLPKNGRERTLRMTQELQAALRAHRHLRGPRVLYRTNGKPVTRAILSAWLRTLELALGLPIVGRGGHVHGLRHTFCSHLAMRGVPVRTIMELAGHSSINTTQRYMQLAPNATDAAICVLEKVPGEIRETQTALVVNH